MKENGLTALHTLFKKILRVFHIKFTDYVFFIRDFRKNWLFSNAAILSAADDIDIMNCSEMYQGFVKDVVLFHLNFTLNCSVRIQFCDVNQ